MVKRRNSPYAPHDRTLPLNQPCDFKPRIGKPLGRRAKPHTQRQSRHWNFGGSFI
jgi:hypothetical protein